MFMYNGLGVQQLNDPEFGIDGRIENRAELKSQGTNMGIYRGTRETYFKENVIKFIDGLSYCIAPFLSTFFTSSSLVS